MSDSVLVSVLYAVLLLESSAVLWRLEGGWRALHAVTVRPGIAVGAWLERMLMYGRREPPRTLTEARYRQARAHLAARRVPTGPTH